MTNPVKQRLEELKELRQYDYITEEEYAVARGNILLEAGFDIVPRTEFDACYTYPPPRRKGRERKRGGCGCFLTLLFLIAFMVSGALFALPEDIVSNLPGLDRLFGIEQVQEARRTILRFIDDLLGHPQTEVPSLPLIASADHVRPEVPPAIPVPLPEIVSAGSQTALENQESNTALPDTKPRLPLPPSSELHPEAGAAPFQAAVDGEGEVPDAAADAAKSSVWGDSVRIRSTPDQSNDDNIIGRARRGELLSILEEITNEDGEKWYHVRLDRGNREGWIQASRVRTLDREKK